ncbi:hypothetical protein BKA70DRAFT_1222324 [Coprinopsis sp. MPI-PUGE-AT-0042]|nr:hypothetical protein BKA70DRAFT_1222324 [Coprinopsis sp. MPI-PUGE-AT-0042]
MPTTMQPFDEDPPAQDNPSGLLHAFLQRIKLLQDYRLPRPLKFSQLLHFDSESNDILPWFWPVYDADDVAVLINPALLNARVAPDDLEEYRRCHVFLAPCCLCAYVSGIQYTETRIVVPEGSGGDSGTFVAECAQQRCGYSVCLELFYPLIGMRLRKYERRARPLDFAAHIAREGVHTQTTRDKAKDELFRPVLFAQSRKRKFEVVDLSASPMVVRKKRLRRLGTTGISDAAFWDTFVRCFQCKKIVLRETAPDIHCCTASIINMAEVIDLTQDDN